MTDEERAVRECCLDDDNLDKQPSDRDDLVIRVCRACGRRHYEAFAEPFEIRTEVPGGTPNPGRHP